MCVFGECYRLDNWSLPSSLQGNRKSFPSVFLLLFLTPAETQTALMKDRMMRLGSPDFTKSTGFRWNAKIRMVTQLKDPLRSAAAAVTAAFVPMTGSEGAGGNRLLLCFCWRYADSLSIWFAALLGGRLFSEGLYGSRPLQPTQALLRGECRTLSWTQWVSVTHTHTHLCCNSSAALVWLISDNADHCLSCSWALCLLSAVQDKLRFDPESEIATTGLRVSLICPVSTPSYWRWNG